MSFSPAKFENLSLFRVKVGKERDLFVQECIAIGWFLVIFSRTKLITNFPIDRVVSIFLCNSIPRNHAFFFLLIFLT
jgi:hypothetical protein